MSSQVQPRIEENLKERLPAKAFARTTVEFGDKGCYKSCMALLKLAERYSPQRLENACRKALSYTFFPSLKSVQSILKSGQDKLLDEDALPKPEEPKAHEFTRGAGYYKRGE